MLSSCNGQNDNFAKTNFSPFFTFVLGDTAADIGKNIDCIFQDKDNNYWFASNGEGAYRYDGKKILHYTTKHGLCSDYVWAIQQDVNGKLWFTTRDGICSFDENTFTDYTSTIKNAAFGKLTYKKGGLFFGHADGMCFYDGTTFTNFTIHPPTYKPKISSAYREYSVYCTLVDNSGKVWFGTQEKGVCCYDGESFKYIDGKDLDGPAVRSIYQDKKGMLWFGNNGGGLYSYDGKTLRNITEERNLGNDKFLKHKMPVDKAGSLARVFAINEDKHGNIWAGTVDAGVWKFHGTTLTNYTTRNGLAGNAVYVIYKDKKGELWFVSNGDAINRFDGEKFSRVNFR